MSEASAPDSGEAPRWQPLTAIQRRVLGVLVEKAKTTPDAYPLTLNALTNGCNQKSNRSPQTNYSGDDVEVALDELRDLGAVAEIQGGGRVNKYRHYVYDWMGVDKVEAAVMTELLLRGEQTLGELRGRAARMEPIADINALRPIVDSLIAKRLVIPLTSPGRGQVITHALYKQRDLDALRNHYASHDEESSESPGPASHAGTSHATSSAGPARPEAGSAPAPPAPTAPAPPARPADQAALAQLRSDVDELKAEVDQLRRQLQNLEAMLS